MFDPSIQNIIWHIADIHIHEDINRKFHEDILYAISKLIDNIMVEERTPIDKQLVVIAGDIFEHKNWTSPKDIKCFHEILRKLSFIKVLIIPGNHDYSPNADPDDCIDLITVNLIPYKLGNIGNNIYMYNKSGIIKLPDFDNIDFHILSPIDKTIPEYGINDIQRPFKIAVLHEPIKGCRAYGSTEIKFNTRFDFDSFNNYNLVLVGDIHKPQLLGPKKNIAYSGSLIQKNKGEEITHGCVKWIIKSDLITIKSEFIPFKLNNALLTIEAKDNKVLSYPKLNLFENVLHLRFKYSNCDEDNISKFKTKIIKKYGKINQIIADKVLLNTINNNETSRVSLSKLAEIPSQVELLTRKLQDNEYKDQILHLHNSLSIEYSNQLEQIKYKWKLDYLYWSDIFCYGKDNFIDFTKLNGIVSLIGRNKTGKSSIIDILIYILYNELLRATSKSIVRIKAKKYKIACQFSVILNTLDESMVDRYFISREGDNIAGNQHQTHRLFKLAYKSEKWENITSYNILGTYKIMNSLIGGLDDIENINIALQENKFIVNKSTKDQLLIFEKYLGLDRLKIIEDIVKEKVKDINGLISNIKKELEEKEKELAGEQNIIAKSKLSFGKHYVYPDKIENIENMLSCLLTTKSNGDRSISKLRKDKDDYFLQVIHINYSIEEINESLNKPDILNSNMSDIDLLNYKNKIADNNQKVDQLYQKGNDIKIYNSKLLIDSRNQLLALPVLTKDNNNLEEMYKSLNENNDLIISLSGQRRNNVNSYSLESLKQQFAKLPIIDNNNILQLEEIILNNETTLKELNKKIIPGAKNLIKLKREIQNIIVPNETLIELENKFNNNISKIQELKDKIIYTKYSIEQYHNLIKSIGLKDEDNLIEIKNLLLANKQEIEILQNQRLSIVITNNYKTKKTKLSCEEIIDYQIEETYEILKSQLTDISKHFNPVKHTEQNYKDFNLSLNDLLIEKKRTELKLFLIDEGEKISTHLSFNDNCDNCKSNKSLFKTSDKNKLSDELAKINGNISKCKQYEIYKNNIDAYQRNIIINNKLDILHDKNHYKELEVIKTAQNMGERVKKLMVENEIIISKIDLLEVREIMNDNINYNNSILQLKEETNILQNNIGALKRYEELLIDIKICENNDSINKTIIELESSNKSIKENIKTVNLRNQLLIDIDNCEHNTNLDNKIDKLVKEDNILKEEIRIIKMKEFLRNNIIKCENNSLIIDEIANCRKENELLSALISNHDEKNQLLEKKIIYENNQILYKKIDSVKKDILSGEKRIDNLIHLMQILNKIKDCLTSYNKTLEKLKELEERKNLLLLYQECINCTNGIPFDIFNISRSNIEVGINNILHDLTDFSISLGGNEEKLQITIVDGENEIPAKQASGYQKFIIDLSMRLCLAGNHPYLPNFFLIDEGFGCMDPEHLLNMKTFIEKLSLRKVFDWMLIISHISELQYINNDHLSIEIIKGKSKIGKKENIPIFPESTITSSYEHNKEIIIDLDVDNNFYCVVCDKSYKISSKENHINSVGHSKALLIYNKNQIKSKIDSMVKSKPKDD